MPTEFVLGVVVIAIVILVLVTLRIIRKVGKERQEDSTEEQITPTPSQAAITGDGDTPPPRPASLEAKKEEATPTGRQTVSAAQASAPGSGQERRGLFIAYRRQDTQHVAGRIYDRLSERYGPDRVFKDVDSVPLGVDYRVHVEGLVALCQGAAILIGPAFLGEGMHGARRIDEPTDLLRAEIRSVLKSGIPVIPVLVDGAQVPREEEMPDDISALAFRNGLSVREDPHFHDDVDRLIEGLDRILEVGDD